MHHPELLDDVIQNIMSSPHHAVLEFSVDPHKAVFGQPTPLRENFLFHLLLHSVAIVDHLVTAVVVRGRVDLRLDPEGLKVLLEETLLVDCSQGG